VEAPFPRPTENRLRRRRRWRLWLLVAMTAAVVAVPAGIYLWAALGWPRAPGFNADRMTESLERADAEQVRCVNPPEAFVEELVGGIQRGEVVWWGTPSGWSPGSGCGLPGWPSPRSSTRPTCFFLYVYRREPTEAWRLNEADAVWLKEGPLGGPGAIYSLDDTAAAVSLFPRPPEAEVPGEDAMVMACYRPGAQNPAPFTGADLHDVDLRPGWSGYDFRCSGQRSRSLRSRSDRRQPLRGRPCRGDPRWRPSRRHHPVAGRVHPAPVLVAAGRRAATPAQDLGRLTKDPVGCRARRGLARPSTGQVPSGSRRRRRVESGPRTHVSIDAWRLKPGGRAVQNQGAAPVGCGFEAPGATDRLRPVMRVVSYPEADLPEALRLQQAALQDQAWPSGPTTPPGLRHDPALHPVSLLLVDDGGRSSRRWTSCRSESPT